MLHDKIALRCMRCGKGYAAGNVGAVYVHGQYIMYSAVNRDTEALAAYMEPFHFILFITDYACPTKC